MNEEVNFCSQCGVKISSGAKFCSNCGHDLKNSSTKITLDKAIKVEVTNATVEKGFKAIGKGLKKVFKTKEKTSKSDLETPSPKHRELPPPHRDGPVILNPFVFFVLIPLAAIVGLVVISVSFALQGEMTNNLP